MLHIKFGLEWRSGLRGECVRILRTTTTTTTAATTATAKTKRIYDGVEAETRKSQASFQIIQVSSEALPRMRLG